MRLPLQISFRNMHHSEVVERAIMERAERIERFSDQIMGCRVVVETRYHRHQGNLYHVRIDLTLPGREIYFHRNSGLDADFDRLEVGDPVRFHEEAGKEGPQASTVHVERKVRAAG